MGVSTTSTVRAVIGGEFGLPDVTFQAGHVPYAPTMEGQYIIKNLLIISAALVVGGTVRRRTDKLPA